MNNENIEEILKNIGAEEIPADVHKIAQETSNNFSSSLRQTKQSKQHILLEQIMKSRITKLAAAAVIFIAVLAGLPLLNPESVALADVLAKIEQVRAFMYKMDMTMTGSFMQGMPEGTMEMHGEITVSNEYGTKWTMDTTNSNDGKTITQQMYMLPNQKLMFTIMPQQKMFVRMELDDELVNRMRQQNNDPRETMKQMVDCGYIKLGRSEICGVKVEGFETTDPKFTVGMAEDVSVKLWVDVETWLPVLMEMDIKMSEQMQMHCVISDFQWDVPVVASDFDPVIPEDYTPLTEDGFKMPAMTEEAAIEGLKFFAEIFGKYPEKIDLMSLMKEFSALQSDENLTEAGLKFKEEMKQITKGQDATKEVAAKTLEIMKPAQSLALFYMMLLQDQKEPLYYGQTVTPDDADAVLLRWKVSDNEYRIIFGDLSVGSATAEELVNLEQP